MLKKWNCRESRRGTILWGSASARESGDAKKAALKLANIKASNRRKIESKSKTYKRKEKVYSSRLSPSQLEKIEENMFCGYTYAMACIG